MRLSVFIIVDGAIGDIATSTTFRLWHCVQNEAYNDSDYKNLDNQLEDNDNQSPYGYDAAGI